MGRGVGLLSLLAESTNSALVRDILYGMRPYGDEDTKHCGRCRRMLPVGEFQRNAARSDGLSGYCAQCQRDVNDVRRRGLRQSVLDYLGGRCSNPDCTVPGGMTDIRCLQVDHINGGGREDRKLLRSPEAFLRDVLSAPPGKYQLLCANCNFIRRVELSQYRPVHTYTQTIPTERHLLRDDSKWKRQFGQAVRERWAAAGPEALAERNRKIAESRTGKNRALTDEQEAEAVQLMREGRTQMAVAKMFGVSGAFMNKLAKREGITFQRGHRVGIGRALTPEQEAEVLERVGRGELGITIAASLGVSKDLVYKIAKREGT